MRGCTAETGPMVAAARSPAEVIGREVELGHLATLLAGAVAGVPSMCVVDGEAGIGKTTLVRDACDRFAGEVLWGTCAHFGAGTVPFGAVASALDGYISRAAEGVRGQVLQGLGDLDALLPSAPEVMEPHPGILLQQFDRAIRRIAHLSPCVLVIDDLQWADQSSLDLLAFLATGFLDQRLAILVTVRDEDRFEGHVLNGWLADLRRLPGISECHLSRLDLA